MKQLLFAISILFCIRASATNVTIGSGSGAASYTNGVLVHGDTLFITAGTYGSTSTISGLSGIPGDSITVMPLDGIFIHDVFFTAEFAFINCKYVKVIGFSSKNTTNAFRLAGTNLNNGVKTGISNFRITQCYANNISQNFIKNYNSVVGTWGDTTTYACYKCQVDSIRCDTVNEIWQGSFSTVAAANDVVVYATGYSWLINGLPSNKGIFGIFLRSNFSYIYKYEPTYRLYSGDVGFFSFGGTGGGFSGVIHDCVLYGLNSQWIARLNIYDLNNNGDSALLYNISKPNSSSFGGVYAQSLYTDTSANISNCNLAMYNVGGGNWPTQNTYYNFLADIGTGFATPRRTIRIKNCYNFNYSLQHGAGFQSPGVIIYEGGGTGIGIPIFDTANNRQTAYSTDLLLDSTTLVNGYPAFKPLVGSQLISSGVSTIYTGVGFKDLAQLTSVANNIGPYQYVPSMYLGYNLPINATTSAGIYNASGILIRQIWGGKSELLGNKSQWWDGMDQFGNIATGGPFSSKLEYHNISANVDGLLGNSATTQSGTNSLSSLWGQGVDGMDAVQVGSTIYYVSGYGEGSPSVWKTPSNNINSRINMIGKTLDCVLEFTCSDGTNLYISGYDAFDHTRTFTYAHSISTEAYVTFSSGTNYNTNITGVTLSCIGYLNGSFTTNQITGLSVQQTHNFLFVTRAALNQVLVINKTTGATVQTIATITGPGRCSVDGSDNVWIADATNIKQYSVNSSTGALTATGVAISLTNVGALRCSPNGSTILAADMTNRVVHAYRSSDGASNWTYGTGDYRTDATVANNKFYWVDSTQQYRTFVTYLSDSTFLIGDRQNARVQHIANDHSTFIESQSFLQTPYYVYVDPKNTSRVFAKWMEFSYNYTTKVWTLVKNWGASIVNTQYDNAKNIIRPVTLSNGRTYCFLIGITVGGYHLCELVNGGVLRVSTINESVGGGQSYTMDSTGALIICSRPGGGIGTVITYTKDTLTGFDGSNNPTWQSSGGVVTTIPATTALNTRGGSITSPVMFTTNGNLILYDYGPTDGTTHLGYSVASVPIGTGAYLWQNLPTDKLTYAGPFPGQGQSPENGGYFEAGNSEQFGGSFVGINGNWIIANHHGEFWKQAQTNFYWLFDDRTGLYLYNFGKSWVFYPSTPSGPQYGVVGTAGNALGGAFVHGSDGNDYLWHGDEAIQDGVTRWQLNGLSAATTITPTLTVSATPPAVIGTDILSNLTAGVQNIPNGTSGWVRSPAADYSDASGHTTSYAGKKSYDIFKSPDLFVDNFIQVSNKAVAFTRQLLPANVRTTSWQQNFDLLWDNNVPNYFTAAPYNAGSFVEILDSAGKIIAEIHIATNFSNLDYVVMNGTTVLSDSTGSSIFRMWHAFQPSSLTYTGGVLTFKYGTVSQTFSVPFETGADMTQPYSMRLHFFIITDGGPVTDVGKNISIQNAVFNPLYVPPSPPGCLNCIITIRSSVHWFH